MTDNIDNSIQTKEDLIKALQESSCNEFLVLEINNGNFAHISWIGSIGSVYKSLLSATRVIQYHVMELISKLPEKESTLNAEKECPKGRND